VFDVLIYRGGNLLKTPLTSRRELLSKVVPTGETSPIRVSQSLEASSVDLTKIVREFGFEGIVAKRRDSQYESGKRTGAWSKYKVNHGQEFVIGGYTAPQGAREHLGALLVGYYEGGKLRYAGKVGTGFTAAALADLARRFRPLVRSTPPFADAPRERGVTWLAPRLVAQIGFMERTADGRLRHPVFLGLREDKAADEVRWTPQTA